jgi:hypothetical protein
MGVHLRGAVNAKCKECIHDPRSGTGKWREQVAQCSVLGCPLWPVRPLPKMGPYANSPAVPATTPPGWTRHPAGWAFPASLQAVEAISAGDS